MHRRGCFSRRLRARGSGLPALRLGGSLVVLGAAPRFLLWWSTAGRTMLLKEYRICMPLTVDEVSAAPGLAAPALGPPLPPPRDAVYPAAASRPSSPLQAARKPGGTLPPKPEGWRGGRKGNCCFHLSPQRGRAALGGAVDSRWALLGAPRSTLLGIRMRQRKSVRPLSPIKKMNKAHPTAPRARW